MKHGETRLNFKIVDSAFLHASKSGVSVDASALSVAAVVDAQFAFIKVVAFLSIIVQFQPVTA